MNEWIDHLLEKKYFYSMSTCISIRATKQVREKFGWSIIVLPHCIAYQCDEFDISRVTSVLATQMAGAAEFDPRARENWSAQDIQQ